MKRIITIILVIMLVAAMTVPACAATVVPVNKIGIKFQMPSISVPDIPDNVKENIKTTLPSNFMNNWLKVYRTNLA